MANLASPDNGGATEPIDGALPQPATHGQVHVSDGHGECRPCKRKRLGGNTER